MDESLDVLELELRQLAGVVGVGLAEEGGALMVRLTLGDRADADDLRRRAGLLARTHSENPVVVVVAGEEDFREASPGPERVRLLAVVRVPTTDELEVHLAFGGRRTIGRHRGAGPVHGAVHATLEAIEALGLAVPFHHSWSEPLPSRDDRPLTVAVGLADDGESRYGIASGASAEEAAVRATLHALNRQLTPLAPAG